MMRGFKDVSGQMTLELAVVLPIVMVVGVIMINALQFFALCATFDRSMHQAVRIYAVSPSYGSDDARSCYQIEQDLRAAFAQDETVSVSVTCVSTGIDLQEFRGQITYFPTLFGISLNQEVFGVALPQLSHETSFVVDVYRPGIVL